MDLLFLDALASQKSKSFIPWSLHSFRTSIPFSPSLLRDLCLPEMTSSSHKSEKVFVTSAAGLLGSATIHYLHYNRPEVAIVGSVRSLEKCGGRFTDMEDALQLIITPRSAL